MRIWASFFMVCAGALAAYGCGDDGSGPGGSGGSGTTSGQGGQGGQVQGTPLTILNWNTKNFLNDLDDSNVMDEVIKTTAEYQAQLTAVAAIIGEIDPDIAVLAEVENQSVLDDLNDALGGAYAERQIIDSPDPRGVDVAALSKIPFSSVVSHQMDSFTVEGTPAPTYQFARDAVEYHFTFEGQKIVLIGVHFRSKGPPDDPNKRLAEAQRTRAIADELTAADPNLGVVILGDFNDLPGSPPYNAVAGSAPDVYTDIATLVPEADRWTFDFQGTPELIDHQMANPLMFGKVDASGVTIRHGTDVGTASDHAPMVAVYRF